MADVVGGGTVAASGDFIDVESLEVFCRIASGSQDAKLTPIVAGINAAIHRYLKRKILSHAEVDHIDGSGFNCEIFLREFPVTAIQSVSIKNGFGEFEELPIDSYTLVSDSENESNRGRVVCECGPWPEGCRNIRVEYQAGYTEVPEDLRLAALQFGQELFRDAKNGKRIQSERLGDYSYSLMTNNSVESLLDARKILAGYRRVPTW